MPRPTGQIVNIVNGQPQREVESFQVSVTYDAALVPHFAFKAFSVVRLRDGQGNIIQQSPGLSQLVNLDDTQVPPAQRTQFTGILAKLDTLADPA